MPPSSTRAARCTRPSGGASAQGDTSWTGERAPRRPSATCDRAGRRLRGRWSSSRPDPATAGGLGLADRPRSALRPRPARGGRGRPRSVACTADCRSSGSFLRLRHLPVHRAGPPRCPQGSRSGWPPGSGGQHRRGGAAAVRRRRRPPQLPRAGTNRRADLRRTPAPRRPPPDLTVAALGELSPAVLIGRAALPVMALTSRSRREASGAARCRATRSRSSTAPLAIRWSAKGAACCTPSCPRTRPARRGCPS